MFTPKYKKEGKMLLKGVAKFVHYKRDILSEEKLVEIGEKQAAFRELLRSGEKEQVQEQAKELQKSCERSLPMPSFPGIRENVEVFFVAIVIALGIRSYFLQPFKIPTGSMQPTLNGILATGGFDQTDEGKANWEKVEPNIVLKVWDLFWRGRNYVDLVAKEDFIITGGHQKNPFKFFSFTYLERTKPNGSKMKPLRIWAPLDKVLASQNGDPGLGLTRTLSKTGSRIEMIKGAASTPSFRVGGVPAKIAAGTVLARGYIDTGDQVLVNKFSYHFRLPKRGEVFVFTTQDIELIMERSKLSQHYIKRLSAVPGDSYEVKPSGELFINGARATEAGAVRVMSKENGFRGFTVFGGDRRNNQGTLEEKEYLALGDNSAHSWDSRGWGPVPEKNLVGPALFVYWPFGAHWGLIH